MYTGNLSGGEPFFGKAPSIIGKQDMIGRGPILEEYTIEGEDGKKYRFTREEKDAMASAFDMSVRECECCHRNVAGAWRLDNKNLCKACWYREKHKGEGHEITEEQGIVTCKCTLPKYEER